MKKKLWQKVKESDADNTESFGGIREVMGDGRDLAFACRLAFEEGPWHHAHANAILINALLKGAQEVADRLGVSISPYDGEVAEVSMPRPPHHRQLSGNGVYPLDMPVNLLISLAGGDELRVQEMVDALSEGAPHHVMANIMTLHMAEALVSLARKAASFEKTGG